MESTGIGADRVPAVRKSLSSVSLVGIGFHGDVMPLISLGRYLCTQGISVTLLSNLDCTDFIRNTGIKYIPISDPEHQARSLCDAHILCSHYLDIFLNRYVLAWNIAVFKHLATNGGDGVVLGVDHGLLWGDLLAHCHCGVPLIRLAIDPPIFPRIAKTRDWYFASGAYMNRMTSVDARWRRLLGAFSIRAGANHVNRLKRHRRRVPSICLWPAWLTGGMSQSSETFGMVGFLPISLPLFEVPIPSQCNASDKLPVIVFVAGTLGTARSWSDHFFDVGRAACDALSLKAIFLGGHEYRNSMADGRWSRFLPLTQILPYAKLIVHHGGIGTAAAAVRFGVPQLIVPRVFAQPSNAEWIRLCGVGVILLPDQYAVGSLINAIKTILHDDRFSVRSKYLATQCEDGVVFARIESILRGVRQF